MYALLRCAHTRKQHVCPAGDTIQRGAYITTKGVVTYAPPAEVRYAVHRGWFRRSQAPFGLHPGLNDADRARTEAEEPRRADGQADEGAT